MKNLTVIIAKINNTILNNNFYFFCKKKNVVLAFLKVLFELNFVEEVIVLKDHKTVKVILARDSFGTTVVKKIKAISSPSKPIFITSEEVSKLSGLTTTILLTEYGLISDIKCFNKQLGGVVLCSIF